jgi:hypothetical protein
MVQTNVLEGAGLPQRPLWVTSGHLRRNRPCPLYPQKRTCAVQLGMSALGQKETSSQADPALKVGWLRGHKACSFTNGQVT